MFHSQPEREVEQLLDIDLAVDPVMCIIAHVLAIIRYVAHHPLHQQID